jgi:hypothetical protein
LPTVQEFILAVNSAIKDYNNMNITLFRESVSAKAMG